MIATSPTAVLPSFSSEAAPREEAVGLGVRRVSDAATLESLAPVWNDLHDRSPHPFVLLDHRWTSAWWRAFGAGKELHVLVVERGERPVGIVPMVLSEGREAWPMRDGRLQIAEDHLNLRLPPWRRVVPVRRVTFPLNVPSHNARAHALAPDHEGDVCAAAIEYWAARRSEWDAIVLEGLPCASGQRAAFQETARRHGLPSPPHGTVRRIFMATLEGGLEGYLAGRSSHFRKRRKEQIRTCERAGRLELTVHRREEIGRGLDIMFDIERATWKARPDPGATVSMAIDARVRGFLGEVGLAFGRTDEAAIHVMRLDGRPVGALMALSRGRTMLSLAIYLRDDVRGCLNTAPLWSAFLADAAAHGITAIDMHGVTQNVRKWSTHDEAFQRLYVFNGTARGRLLWGSKALATGVSRRIAAWRDRRGEEEHGRTERDPAP